MGQQSREYRLIGCSSDFGGIVQGAAAGPRALRSAGLVQRLAKMGIRCADGGEVISLQSQFPDRAALSAEDLTIHNIEEVYSVCSQLSEEVAAAVSSSQIPLILGGDHSISVGTMAGLSRTHSSASLGLLWVDAHADINTPNTSPSHCAFGMPVAFITGACSGILSTLSQHSPMVDPQKVAWIGLRDVDRPEAERIRQQGMHAFTMQDIDRRGIAAVINDALAVVTGGGSHGFALSFDLDVCDPNFAPGVGTPWRGGLTYREAHLVLESAYETGKIEAIEMVELNPRLDQQEQTAEVALSLLESALGKTIL